MHIIGTVTNDLGEKAAIMSNGEICLGRASILIGPNECRQIREIHRRYAERSATTATCGALPSEAAIQEKLEPKFGAACESLKEFIDDQEREKTLDRKIRLHIADSFSAVAMQIWSDLKDI